jgi:putative FmdB family regulatory protein
MPIYEYACDKCGHEFEREQKMADPPVKTCPECKGRKVTKLISRSSFVLKGGGWYADGYADSKKSAKDAKDEGSKETKAPISDSSKKSSDSKESKPSKKKGKGSSKSAA